MKGSPVKPALWVPWINILLRDPTHEHQILFSFPTATALERSGLISAARESHLGRWSGEGGSTEVKTYSVKGPTLETLN